MQTAPVNLAHKLTLFAEHWSPRVVAEMNDYQFKLVKLQGEFIWHKHADTDETFFCLNGELDIQLRDRTVTLRAGDLFVVPRDVEHRPVAKDECHALLIEPRGVVNTGDADSERTAEGDVWI